MTLLDASRQTKNGSPQGKKERVVVVIGGGIVGLAHAWAAARRGMHVRLFERHPRACGASIRNFGMVWPIGQASGALHRTAMLSRQLWTEMLRETRLWHADCGSLHLAYRSDELAVLSEFSGAAAEFGYDCRLLTPPEVLKRSPAARREGLLGGLWSPSEACVDPREIIASMPAWLEARYGVRIEFATAIRQVSLPWVVASDGRRWQADRAIVAGGADFHTLYPDVFRQTGFRICKLQMMRTVPQPAGWQLGPMLAGGLTLRHYASFAACQSLRALKDRIAHETPELDQYGIHVMAAQNGRGEVILGDSHEYDDKVAPFDKAIIDDLILRELRRFLDLPDWTIGERWHGIYVQLPGTIQFMHEPEPGVTIAIASGGCGMTMSFGLAEEQWAAWEGKPSQIPCETPA